MKKIIKSIASTLLACLFYCSAQYVKPNISGSQLEFAISSDNSIVNSPDSLFNVYLMLTNKSTRKIWVKKMGYINSYGDNIFLYLQTPDGKLLEWPEGFTEPFLQKIYFKKLNPGDCIIEKYEIALKYFVLRDTTNLCFEKHDFSKGLYQVICIYDNEHFPFSMKSPSFEGRLESNKLNVLYQ